MSEAIIDTLTCCAKRGDVSRRGHVVGLWWQMLSVAVQKEHARVLRQKVGACTGESEKAELSTEDVFSFDTFQNVEFLKCSGV